MGKYASGIERFLDKAIQLDLGRKGCRSVVSEKGP